MGQIGAEKTELFIFKIMLYLSLSITTPILEYHKIINNKFMIQEIQFKCPYNLSVKLTKKTKATVFN